jgi:hypothetical protein
LDLENLIEEFNTFAKLEGGFGSRNGMYSA